MKMLMAIFLTLTCAQVFAQSDQSSAPTSTAKQQYLYPESEDISRGFRLTLVKSFLTGKVSAADQSMSGDVNQQFGLGVGYALIRNNAIGFTTNLYWNSFSGDHAPNAFRLDGNIDYGFAGLAYVFGGLNLQKLSGSTGSDQLNWDSFSTGMGFQIGIGANITPTFGASLAYVYTDNTYSIVDLSMSGLEMMLHATF